jgi:hypothetical protein
MNGRKHRSCAAITFAVIFDATMCDAHCSERSYLMRPLTK